MEFSPLAEVPAGLICILPVSCAELYLSVNAGIEEFHILNPEFELYNLALARSEALPLVRYRSHPEGRIPFTYFLVDKDYVSCNRRTVEEASYAFLLVLRVKAYNTLRMHSVVFQFIEALD